MQTAVLFVSVYGDDIRVCLQLHRYAIVKGIPCKQVIDIVQNP